jgi:hypothetical protein
MKKVVLAICVLAVFLVNFMPYSANPFFKNVEAKSYPGHWKQVEIKTLEDRYDQSPVELSLSGRDGMVQVGMSENKTSATLDWSWTPPPRILPPGIQWRSKISGLIQEWSISNEYSSTLGMKFQAFNASCCDPYGVDFGMLNLGMDEQTKLRQSKSTTQTNPIPRLGDLDSAKSSKIQFLVNIVQQGGSFQWIYIYEWVKSSPLVEIKLSIGQQSVEVNKDTRFLDTPAYISNQRTFVPFRFVGEAMGAFIDFKSNPESGLTEEVIYELDKNRIVFYVLEKRMEKNGVAVADAPAVEIRNHRVMVPVRILSESLGAQVEWNAKAQEVVIKQSF